ncbi:AMP-dependent synthetase [Rhodobacteraceae bacterium RKSG542]|uniref:AMP-binding protein n=1 Tax=Pseudovibrio flavus TaxID=2529854 RepID=UPI0012BCC12C|nr:AMP-binding protein [Pseudovibrio flavus]MTI16779.1 AMP-dependent synthetase [Pseudovibrio flavus]
MSYIGNYLKDYASQRPNALALLFEGGAVTNAALFETVEKVAAGLSQKGIRGQRVGICNPDPFQFCVAFLGVIRSGNTAVVLDPEWPKERLEKLRLAANCAETIDSQRYDELIASGEASPRVDLVPDESDAFYIGFTSGSTGEPKGYCRNHLSWLKSFEVSSTVFGVGEGDCVAVPGPVAHSHHLYGALHALHSGASLIMAAKFQPKAFIRAMESGGATVLYGTPTQLNVLARAAKTPLLKVTKIISSGAKWLEDNEVHLKTAFPNAKVLEVYGASELSFVAVTNPVEQAPIGSVGRPVPQLSLEIRDGDGNEVPSGVSGRIWVNSPLVMSGYVAAGSADFVRDGDFVSIGDHGYFDENGFLFVSGRENRMIITSGLNIYPEEIERVLLSLDGVTNAAVFGEFHELRGQTVLAILQAEGAGGTDEFARQMRDKAGAARSPKRYILHKGEWPLTRSGKTDLVALQNQYAIRIK